MSNMLLDHKIQNILEENESDVFSDLVIALQHSESSKLFFFK